MPGLTRYLCTVLKSYPSSWLRLVLLCMSLVIACMGVSAVLTINQGARQSYAQQGQGMLSQVSAKIQAKDQQAISKTDYAQLRRLGVNEAVALSTVRSHLFNQQQQQLTTQKVTISGLDSLPVMASNKAIYQPGSDQSAPLLKAKSGQAQALQSSFGSLSHAPQQALVHQQLYQLLKADNDSVITLASGKHLPPLKRVDNATMGNDIVMDIALFAEVFDAAPISKILLVGELSQQRQAFIRALLPPHLSLQMLPNSEQSTAMTDSFHLNLLAMALLMFVVCLFIVMNACNLLLNQRLPMLKIFRQLGLPRLTIILGQLIELFAFALICAAIGVYLGVTLALYLAPGIQATLQGLFNVSVGFGQVSYLSLYVQVLLLSLAGLTAATMLPIKELNQALSQVKNNGVANSKQFLLLALLFSAAAAIGSYLSHSILMSLLTIALLILAGCCWLIACYPAVLNALSNLLPGRWPLLHWSLRHSLWLSARSKIACCAFFIALMSNLGMNLMVDSFREATHAWLSQRLMADYYLYQDDKIDVRSKIEELQLDIKVVQRFEERVEYKGLPLQVQSYPSAASFLKALATQSELPQAARLFTQGGGAYINQQFALRHKISLGQMIVLPIGSGGSTSRQVLAIIYDYGNPYAQVLLPPDDFTVSNKRSNILSLYGTEEAIERLAEALTSLGFDRDSQLYSAAQIVALSMVTFERTFVITDSLNIITLLVAAVSMACGIIVLMQDSKPQLTLLRAMGVSKLAMQGLSLLQYGMLCLLALLFAIPFGILLSWLLINLVNKQAFYWTYPLHISIEQIASVAVTSLLVVTLIILLPVINANNRALIKDIRWLN
jgi:putative ABC transport system permease protein